jgi:hypothetical protein
MDWTARYLHGGAKVYAFHSLDLSTRDLHQTLSDNKRRATAEAHALDSWETLGLPHAVLIDNDADWCGSLKTARYCSHFMRLRLWVGIEPMFTPIAAPAAKGSVERLNGLWQQQFWNLHEFQSLATVGRHSPKFVQWYRTTYEPPTLGEQTPAQAQRAGRQRRLTRAERRHIPAKLPLTAGRLHFIRRVDAHGDITLLHETWHVHKRWAGQYVWATISLPEQQLRLYRAHPTQHRLRLCKVFGYRVAKAIRPLQPRFRRFRRRRKICTMT